MTPLTFLGLAAVAVAGLVIGAKIVVAVGGARIDAALVDLDFDRHVDEAIALTRTQLDYTREALEEAEFALILAASYPEGLPEFGDAA